MLLPAARYADLDLDTDGAQLCAQSVDEAAYLRLEAALAALPSNIPGVRIREARRLKPFLDTARPIGAIAAAVLGPDARAARAILFASPSAATSGFMPRRSFMPLWPPTRHADAACFRSIIRRMRHRASQLARLVKRSAALRRPPYRIAVTAVPIIGRSTGLAICSIARMWPATGSARPFFA